MNIYLVVLKDRHIDTQVEAFRKQQDALKRAEEIVKQYAFDDEEPEFETPWLFYANLSTEGDYVYVEVVELK